MKILWNLTLFLGLFMWIPVTYSHSSPVPEDQDISGDDEESSGSGFAEHEPAWVTDVPVMPTEMTTRSPVTISYSPYTSVSKSLLTIYQHVSLKDVVLEETTAVSRIVPKETTTVFQKRLASTEVVDYTKKANFKEDNRPTISIKVTDKNTTVIMTTEGRNSISPVFEDIIMSDDRAVNSEVVNSDMDSDFHFDNDNKSRKAVPVNDPVLAYDASSGNNSLLERKEVLAGVIAGGVVGLLFAIMLISLMVYRIKKKDEGSYALEDHIQSNVGYQKPQKQVEFLA